MSKSPGKEGSANAVSDKVQLCAQGLPDLRVAEQTGVTHATTGKWRKRFIGCGVDVLSDAPLPGTPRTIADEDGERVIKLTLESALAEATHWSTRSMAARSGMSQTAISRFWRAFGLEPHLAATFKISSDPFFIQKTKDVVGLYMSPPEKAVVYCVDEKTKSKPLIALGHYCPCVPVKQNAGLMTINAMGQQISLPLCIPRQANFLAELTNKQIKRRCHKSVRAVESAIESYIAQTNCTPKPFVWVKTAKQIIKSVGRSCSRISKLGH